MAGAGRKVLKFVGWALGVIVVLLGVVAVVVVVTSNRMLAKTVTVPVSIAEIAIPESDASAVVRVKYRRQRPG